VVPALAAGGGVPAVARFLCEQIERSGHFDLRVYSLASSASDACSLRLLRPSSWRGYPRTAAGCWEGREYTHVGAVAVELEFQRYRPRRILRQALRQCDLIQVVAGTPAAALAVVSCGQPVVLDVASRANAERAKALRTGHPLMRWWRSLMTAITDRLDTHALRRVSAVIVLNDWMQRYASLVCTTATPVLKAIPGVDCELYRPEAERAAAWRRRRYILYVGRLADPRKNLQLLCRAYAQLCAALEEPPELVLAGQGALPPAAEAELAPLAARRLLAIVNSPDDGQLRQLYQGALCLALSSSEEGFGMVVIEAMASGIPVVSTRCGGPQEIITDGVDGYLVPLDDSGELAARLATLCSNPELNLEFGRRARSAALSRYSDVAAFGPILQIYQRLLRQTWTPP
jgi:glycosyltransferase involved in cell wall biosynthesis